MSDMANTLDYVYVIMTCCMSVLSLFGCFLIIFTFFCFKELRTKGRQILLCLSIADMITALGNILGAAWAFNKDLGLAFCKFQVALHVFSTNSMYFWNVSMATYLYVALVKVKLELADRLIPYMHVGSWSLPMLILTVALSVDVLGPDLNNQSPAWCWISSEVPAIVFWQLFVGKFWEIITYIFVAVTYGIIVCSLKKRKKRVNQMTSQSSGSRVSSSTIIDEANVRLTFVPLVFILFRIWGTIRFLVNTIVTNPSTSFIKGTSWLAILQGIGDSAQGFTNCIIFCFLTARVRQLLCSGCKRHLSKNQPIVLNDVHAVVPPY